MRKCRKEIVAVSKICKWKWRNETSVESLSISGKDKIYFSLLPLAAPESPSTKMSHSMLFPWIMIQIFTAHTTSATVVRGVTGQPVNLPCNYKVTGHDYVYDICWGRGPCPNSKCKNTILDTTGSTVRYRKSQRYSLRGSVSFGDVSLTIGMVKAEDAGTYCCRVEIPGWFNDIKQNIRLEVARAPPVMTTTTRKAPGSPRHFRGTTFAPQETPGLQPTAQTAVLKTTTTESPALTVPEAIAPPTIAVTADYTFPGTTVTTSALPDFPASSPKDDEFCFTEFVPSSGSTEVTTEFSNILPTAEGSTSAHTAVRMEDVPAKGLSGNLGGEAKKLEDSGDKFPNVILIACATGGGILFILMFSLFWKCKQAKKSIIKSVGPPEEREKVFSGAEGENSIFSL